MISIIIDKTAKRWGDNTEPCRIVTPKGTAKSHIRGAETLKPIAIKFCMPGAI